MPTKFSSNMIRPVRRPVFILGSRCPAEHPEQRLDVKELPSGVYMIEYKDDEYCETIKFVKE